MGKIRYSLPSLFIVLAACCLISAGDSSTSWTGDYHYEEIPVKSEAGYYMTMVWHFTVLKDGTGMLEVNGQQTFIQLKAKITGTADEMVVIHDKLLDGDAGTLKKGNTLFKLKRTGNGLLTHWYAMKPRLNEQAPIMAKCFQLKAG